MNSITDLLNSKNEYYDSQKVPGFVQGTVVENNNPDFKGMVKVEFTAWEDGKNMCEWVRLLTRYTGGDYGSYLVPEINEIVLVGFVGGSLKRPFLLGSLYPSGAGIVNESFHEKNAVKHLKTKGGLDIKISDEAGKQSISIMTPKENFIRIEDELETCAISDKSGKNTLLFDYKNGAAEIRADKKISLKAGGVEIQMDGSGGKLSVKADMVEMKGSNSVKIESTANLSMKGQNTVVEGSARLTAKGGAQAELTGGIVKIN